MLVEIDDDGENQKQQNSLKSEPSHCIRYGVYGVELTCSKLFYFIYHERVEKSQLAIPYRLKKKIERSSWRKPRQTVSNFIVEKQNNNVYRIPYTVYVWFKNIEPKQTKWNETFVSDLSNENIITLITGIVIVIAYFIRIAVFPSIYLHIWVISRIPCVRQIYFCRCSVMCSIHCFDI